MRNTRFGWVVVCTLAAIPGCRAHPPNWNGIWKLNTSKSSYQGQVTTISISADGEYHTDDGAVSFTFRCDGKFRPIGHNRTQDCVKSNATTLDMTRMENGVETNTYHWELSAGGKIFTSTATALRPSGPVIMGQLIRSRISGSNDFVGQWQDMNFLQHHAGLTLRLDNQYLHIGSPSVGNSVDAPLNGADAAPQGPNAIVGMTYAVREIGEREILIQAKLNGKEISQESLKLSDDGGTITDSWSNLAQPTGTATLVYGKR